MYVNASQIAYEDFVSGQRIMELADWQYNTLNSKECHPVPDYLEPISIYCHTEFANQLMRNMVGRTPFVLITHNGDGKITDSPANQFDADINLIPSNLIHWFGQNVMVQHPKITSIPIGLENRCWFSEVDKQRQIANIRHTPRKPINFCYMNFNLNTNPERQFVFNHLRDQDWIDVDMRGNGSDFKSYIYHIYNHHYVLCPEGNSNEHPIGGGGVSSHRAWECLYVDTIPIMTKGPQVEHFNLPILLIDSWYDVTEELLWNSFYKIKEGQYDFRCMDLSYWHQQIWSMKCKI